MIKSYILFIFASISIFYITSMILHMGSNKEFDTTVYEFLMSFKSLNLEFNFTDFFIGMSATFEDLLNSLDRFLMYFKAPENFKLLDFLTSIGTVAINLFRSIVVLLVSVIQYIYFFFRLVFEIFKLIFV